MPLGESAPAPPSESAGSRQWLQTTTTRCIRAVAAAAAAFAMPLDAAAIAVSAPVRAAPDLVAVPVAAQCSCGAACRSRGRATA